MARFVKTKHVVEALQFEDKITSVDDMAIFLGGTADWTIYKDGTSPKLKVPVSVPCDTVGNFSIEIRVAEIGDWVVKDSGEFSVVRQDEFYQQYTKL